MTIILSCILWLHDNATLACFHHNRLTTRWLVDAVQLIICYEWRLHLGWLVLMYQNWQIAFISQVVSLLSSSRMTIGGSADERTCFDVRRRVVLSSNCISYYLKGSVCLTVPFQLISHWSVGALGSAVPSTLHSNRSVGALGSALPSTLHSNHVLSNLWTAWQDDL